MLVVYRMNEEDADERVTILGVAMTSAAAVQLVRNNVMDKREEQVDMGGDMAVNVNDELEIHPHDLMGEGYFDPSLPELSWHTSDVPVV